VREIISELFSFAPISEEPPKKKAYLDIGLFFCLLITLAVTWWFYEFNRNLARDSFSLTHIEWLGVTAAMYGLALVPLALVLPIERFAFKTKLLPALGLNPRPNAVKGKLVYIAPIFIVNLIVFAVRYLLRKSGQITPMAFLFQIPANLLVVSCEEVMFRGYIQGVLVRRFGDVPGILAAAVLFLAVHLPVRLLLQYENVVQLTYSLATTLAGGVVFGVAARKDRCIYGSAALHFSFNIFYYITLM